MRAYLDIRSKAELSCDKATVVITRQVNTQCPIAGLRQPTFQHITQCYMLHVTQHTAFTGYLHAPEKNTFLYIYFFKYLVQFVCKLKTILFACQRHLSQHQFKRCFISGLPYFHIYTYLHIH